jgi:hypothetical protein
MNAGTLQGSCLCEQVQFELAPPLPKFVHCHCSRCRKSSGAAHSTNIAVKTRQLTWARGESFVAEYRLPTAERFGKAFCRECGCPLPRHIPGADLWVVPAGSLNGPLPWTPTDHARRESSTAIWVTRFALQQCDAPVTLAIPI